MAIRSFGIRVRNSWFGSVPKSFEENLLCLKGSTLLRQRARYKPAGHLYTCCSKWSGTAGTSGAANLWANFAMIYEHMLERNVTMSANTLKHIVLALEKKHITIWGIWIERINNKCVHQSPIDCRSMIRIPFKCNLPTLELGWPRPQETLTLTYNPRKSFLCGFIWPSY